MDLLVKMILGLLWGIGSSYVICSMMPPSGMSLALVLLTAGLGGLAIGLLFPTRSTY